MAALSPVRTAADVVKTLALGGLLFLQLAMLSALAHPVNAGCGMGQFGVLVFSPFLAFGAWAIGATDRKRPCGFGPSFRRGLRNGTLIASIAAMVGVMLM